MKKSALVCVACKGTGIRSVGGPCLPCDGTGKPRASKSMQRQWALNKVTMLASRLEREMSLGRDTPITDQLFERACQRAIDLGVPVDEVEALL